MFVKNSEDMYNKSKEALKEKSENIKAKEKVINYYLINVFIKIFVVKEIATLNIRREEAKRLREENKRKIEELNISIKSNN